MFRKEKRTDKRIAAYTAATAVAALGISSAVGWILTELALYPKRKSLKSALLTMEKRGVFDSSYYENLSRKPFAVRSGTLNLSCELILSPKSTDRTKVVVFTHGHGFNRAGMVKFAPVFLNHGYNIVLYDNRGSGESDGRMVTMGHLEKDDLRAVIDKVFLMFGKDIQLGLAGESMGGATSILCAAADERVSFVLCDCAYADFGDQIKHNVKKTAKLPTFPISWFCSLFFTLRVGIEPKKISPKQALVQLKRDIPIFFAHGTKDDYVPCSMTESMYNAYKGTKEVFFGEGSGHTRCIVDHAEEYESRLGKFLDEI